MSEHNTGAQPPLAPDAQYSAYLQEGRFMLQRNRQTGRAFFYPRVAEPGTGCTDLEWFAPSGLGRVYAVTVISQRPPAQAYGVVLVDLDEGPRMMSRVDGIAPEEVRIGQRVQAKVIQENDAPLVVFECVEEGA